MGDRIIAADDASRTALLREIRKLEASMARMDEMDSDEVDSDEYQETLSKLVRLREALGKKS